MSSLSREPSLIWSFETSGPNFSFRIKILKIRFPYESKLTVQLYFLLSVWRFGPTFSKRNLSTGDLLLNPNAFPIFYHAGFYFASNLCIFKVKASHYIFISRKEVKIIKMCPYFNIRGIDIKVSSLLSTITSTHLHIRVLFHQHEPPPPHLPSRNQTELTLVPAV